MKHMGKGVTRQFEQILSSMPAATKERIEKSLFVLGMLYHIESLEDLAVRMGSGKGVNLDELQYHKEEAIKKLIVFTEQKARSETAVEAVSKLLDLPPKPYWPN